MPTSTIGDGTSTLTRKFDLLSTLREMQNRDEMTDTELRADGDVRIFVHSIVLAIHPFWAQILEDKEDKVVLFPEWSKLEISQFVENIYSQPQDSSRLKSEEIIKLEPSDFFLDADDLGNLEEDGLDDLVNEDHDEDNDYFMEDEEENGVENKNQLSDLKVEASDIKDTKTSHLCDICDIEMPNGRGLKRHIQEQHPHTPFCRKCCLIFQDPEELSIHTETVHKNKPAGDLSFIVQNLKIKEEIRVGVEAGRVGPDNFVCTRLTEDGTKCDSKPFRAGDGLQYHLSIHHLRGLYHCTKCDKLLNNRKEKWRHILRIHSESKDKIACPDCGKKCKNENGLKYHQKKFHGLVVKNESWSRLNPEFVTLNTNVKTSMLAALKASTRTTDGKNEFQCEQMTESGFPCPLVYEDPVKFKKHLLNEHFPGLYYCKICDKHLNNRVQKYHHLTRHHPDSKVKQFPGKDMRKFQCDICDFKAMNNHILSRHRDKVHINPPSAEEVKLDEKATCDICLREYKTLRNMLDHKKKIHEGGGIPCEICGKIFRTMRAVALHAEIHAGIMYPCDKCGKDFSSKQALTSHTNNYHGKVQEYVCIYCGKLSNTYVTHKRHQETHTRERKFVCDICPAAYNRKHKLDMHKKTHSDAKDFECDVCQARFKVHYILQRHKAIHQERRHKCNVCKFASHQSFDLTRHYRTVHSIDRPKETYLTYKQEENDSQAT